MIEILEHSAALETAAKANDRLDVAAGVRRRAIPIVLMVAIVASTMAYSLWWGPVVLHRADWLVKADIWGSFRTAQFVAWGDIGDIYRSGGGLVSFPGISVALAPVALLVNHTGLSAGFPVGIAHPTAWLVLGPAVAIIGSIVLIPLDAVAEELGLGRPARLASSLAEALVLWPVLAIWGHPEDSLALAFMLWGLLAAFRGRWRTSGWLWGLALVLQPLVVLVFPIVLAMAPRRQWPRLVLKSALPSAVLLALPLAQSWGQTTRALLKQPNFPTVDHPTPWLSLAPVLSKARTIRVPDLHETRLAGGGTRFGIGFTHLVYGETVAAGPGRLIALAMAALLGIYVYRRRPSLDQLLWLACVALSLRCVFEAVMDPYYLWPPLAIVFVLVARNTWRFGFAAAVSVLLTWWSYRFLGPWEWWVPVVVMLGVLVGLASPNRMHALQSVTSSELGPNSLLRPADALVGAGSAVRG